MIPLCEPKLFGDEWEYLKDCLNTNNISSVGPYVNQFETIFEKYLGQGYHAIACINGTAALHIALLVAGVQPDEEVIIPALTFIAPANTIRYVGAWPVFIDVEHSYWQLDPQKVYDFLTEQCHVQKGVLINRNTGRKVVAILPVHILGHPVDMDPILEVAKRFNLIIIEDAAESLGAIYKGKRVGTLSDIACFSFNGNKIITSGGGGMIVTQNRSWAEKVRYFTMQAKDDPLEYIHHEIGYNYRLSNLQAAVGVAQMQHLNECIRVKNNIAKIYKKGLANISGIIHPITASWATSIFWLYTILIEPNVYGINSRQLYQKLRENNIQSRPFWCPLHTLRPFVKCYAYKIEVAEKLYKSALSLPSSVGLTETDQKYVINSIWKYKF